MSAPSEKPVGLVRGTRDWLPSSYEPLYWLEGTLIDHFRSVGYRPMRVPVLERADLHERKSGAGIVSKLFEVADGGRLSLRPELTAGVVRAFVESAEPLPVPWRVCVSGPVFRDESGRPGFDREFTQVGVEMLGASGPRPTPRSSGWPGRRWTASRRSRPGCGSATSG